MRNASSRARVSLAVIAAFVVLGLAHAATSIYETPGARYVMHWTWNSPETNTSTVEVLLKAAPPRRPPNPSASAAPQPIPCTLNVKVEVKALAEDGSTVQNYALAQLKAAQPKKVEIPFDETLTSLQFIRILRMSSTGSCDPG